LCFQRRISTCALQRVRKNGEETRVAGRLSGQIGISLLAGKEGQLRGPRTAIRLDPAPAMRGGQRAGPQANLLRTPGRVGHFENNAAHVFISEEIIAGELQIVLCAFHVAEEGIAAPTSKEAVITCFRYLWLPPHRNRRPFYDNLPAIAGTGGLRAINA